MGARYAQALFDLAVETNSLDAIEADLKSLKAMRVESKDLRDVLVSPRFSADDKAKSLKAAIGERAGFNPTTGKFLGLLAAQRPHRPPWPTSSPPSSVCRPSGAALVSALVTTAVALTDAQADSLKVRPASAALGKDPQIETKVDPAILGGLKVRVGSRLYDASLKSKLDSLKFALKRA